MPTPRIFRTAAFRLAFFYATMFAIGGMVLVAFFDMMISNYVRDAVHDDVTAELQLLLDTAPGSQPATIAGLVRQRQEVLRGREFLYWVADAEGRPLAGDLPPNAARRGWSKVEVPAPADHRESEDETAEVRSLGVALPGGGLLVVGRSTYAFHELSESIVEATIVAGALISLMSAGAAFLIGRHFLRRIDRVSAAATEIVEGRSDARLPAIGMGDEFDRLATNLNAMLARMQQLMAGLRQVSSDIAHDLRTPLTRLRRRLEAAVGVDSGSVPPDLIQDALLQLDDILDTFSALLRIAQVEGGTGREAFRTVDLSDVLDRLRQVYEPVAEDHSKELVAHVVADVHVAGDEDLLAQLVSNLLENAFVHAVGSPHVTLALEAANDRAILTVRDGGPGVPPAERDRVLQRFYRLDSSRSTAGAGLGLSMVQAITHLHAGEIGLSDNAPGLCVRISLPRLR